MVRVIIAKESEKLSSLSVYCGGPPLSHSHGLSKFCSAEFPPLSLRDSSTHHPHMLDVVREVCATLQALPSVECVELEERPKCSAASIAAWERCARSAIRAARAQSAHRGWRHAQ